MEIFCTEHGVNQIDILKIDAQGYDLAVLRGGERLLRDEVIPFIIVEASILTGDTTNQPLGNKLLPCFLWLCLRRNLRSSVSWSE
ncbi:MAG: FkbM family methyltransferase [Verrucomicrobia bacterium]|nr:FkbM family methyltransferase [Verrucomicrobiota bacterium]